VHVQWVWVIRHLHGVRAEHVHARFGHVHHVPRDGVQRAGRVQDVRPANNRAALPDGHGRVLREFDTKSESLLGHDVRVQRVLRDVRRRGLPDGLVDDVVRAHGRVPEQVLLVLGHHESRHEVVRNVHDGSGRHEDDVHFVPVDVLLPQT